jgi:hypothetical protein
MKTPVLKFWVLATIILLGTAMVPGRVLATLPTNTTCSTAIVLPVLKNRSSTQGVYNVTGGAVVGNPTPSLICNQSGRTPANEVWYTAKSITNGLKLYWSCREALLEVYTGDCNNLTYKTCSYIGVSFPINRNDTIVNLYDPAGTNYYFRILGFRTTGFPAGLTLYIAATTLIPPRRIVSKRLAGLWSDSTTWVGNKKPIANDTIIIDDYS